MKNHRDSMFNGHMISFSRNFLSYLILLVKKILDFLVDIETPIDIMNVCNA